MDTMKRFLLYLMVAIAALPALAQEDNDTTATSNASEEQQEKVQQESQKEEHVSLLGAPLTVSPQQMVDVMTRHGIRYEWQDSNLRIHYLRGKLRGMDIAIEVKYDKKQEHINYIKMSTAKHRNQNEDYSRMLHWLQQKYDNPDWQGSVRSHRFCRWFADFDRDIVLIAAGDGTVETWFYENHLHRNIDYYSILKYCERYPAEDVPFLTARESVTWKSDTVVSTRKHVAKRHRHATSKKKRSSKRKKTTTKRKSKRRRR